MKKFIYYFASLLLVLGMTSFSYASDKSVKVVIIGGNTLNTACTGITQAANYMGATTGGCLPVTGPAGELGDFIFTAMTPSSVSAASLAAYDTAVLNVASSAMACRTSTLSAQQKADLIAFVSAGKKLIVFDSECYPGPVDYTWLPYPFTTANPGARGAHGTLTIVEENTLSSNDPLDPYYINAIDLSNNTDAVGDMNVMTTYDPNWCVDMSGTNYLKITGPVHTYAKYPVRTDVGLIIYNGLDQDYEVSNNANLRKIWVQELRQPFNPSGLPCGKTAVGITLAPPSASNPPGTSHTVTATLTDLLLNPQANILVTFQTVTGPNMNASGTCSPNSDCSSDTNGQVSFTYTSNGSVGTDYIIACFTDSAAKLICSQEVTKQWICTDNDHDGYAIEGGMCGPVDCDDNDASVHPGAVEICNGKDDDCDGLVDNGLVPTPTTCGVGVCASTGTLSCVNGAMVDSCKPGTPGVEVCDGKDNDCDGVVDNGLPSTPTTCGVGQCASTGTLSCVNGSMVDSCKPGTPGVEVCDGKDNDCDGVVDNGLVPTPTTCGVGQCASTGTLSCVNGAMVDSCKPGTPGVEVCDGKDNDCDGVVDNGLASTPTTCGVGACASTGTLSCVNGAMVDSCKPGTPGVEVCDGKDNDCNGSTDENYVFNGFQQPINSDGSSIFKLGSTIPVKIVITNCSGQNVSTATVTIAVSKISDAILGTEIEQLVDASGNANTGNLFRLADGQYIFNLSTKGYTKGTYRIYAKPDKGSAYFVDVSLK